VVMWDDKEECIICIVSSSGTLVNKEHTSKGHTVSSLCLCDFAQSAKVKSLIVNWLVEIGLTTF